MAARVYLHFSGPPLSIAWVESPHCRQRSSHTLQVHAARASALIDFDRAQRRL